MDVRCKHCSKSLFKGDYILFNAHYEVKQQPDIAVDIGCQAEKSDSCSYMTSENAPDWIMNIINRECWTKGKLHCPYCNSRLGSFNFVSNTKCYCDKHITPPIRIVNSKIDLLYERIK